MGSRPVRPSSRCRCGRVGIGLGLGLCRPCSCGTRSQAASYHTRHSEDTQTPLPVTESSESLSAPIKCRYSTTALVGSPLDNLRNTQAHWHMYLSCRYVVPGMLLLVLVDTIQYPGGIGIGLYPGIPVDNSD